MKAKYTKKAAKDIFNALQNDNDFLRAFDKIYQKINPQYNGNFENQRQEKSRAFFERLKNCIDFYLFNFDYLDKKYQDISYLQIKQNGRICLVDLDCLFDIFVND